jgi:hypothetical protein
MYINTLSLSNSIDMKIQHDKLFDRVKSMIQNKVMDIYDYITNILKGDNGFLLDKYGDRNIAFGTRNVLSINIKSSNKLDQSNLNPNDTGLSLLQALKSYQLLIVNKHKLIMSGAINSISKVGNFINSKSLEMESISMPTSEVKKYTEEAGIEKILNNMKYDSFRNSPIVIKGVNGNDYYLAILYDLGNVIFRYFGLSALKKLLKKYNIELKKSKVRPLTWYEWFYTIAYQTIELNKRVGCVTRYPVIQPESIKPLYAKIYTTNPSRKVTVIRENKLMQSLPRYPIIQNKSIETIINNSLTMKGHNADTDGDMCSFTGALAEDSNEELINHIESPNALLQNSGDFQLIEEDTSDIIIKALSFK